VRLTGYLFLFSLRRFAGTFGVLLLIYCAVDFVEASSLVTGDLWALFCAYPFKLPSVITHILPPACAIGAVVALANLRSSGEWNAFMAAGLSPFRLVFSLLLISLICAVLIWPITQTLAPLAYSQYEVAAGLVNSDAAELSSNWSRDGAWLIRRSGDGAVLAVERSGTGRAIRWQKFKQGSLNAGRELIFSWSDDDGFSVGDVEGRRYPFFNSVPELPHASIDGLFAADRTSADLESLSIELRTHGLSSTALDVQILLRRSISVSCLMVTAIALMFSLLCSHCREVALVGLALFVSAAYWLLLFAVQNGTLAGAFSSAWLFPGVPIVTAGIAFIAGIIAVISTPARL